MMVFRAVSLLQSLLGGSVSNSIRIAVKISIGISVSVGIRINASIGSSIGIGKCISVAVLEFASLTIRGSSSSICDSVSMCSSSVLVLTNRAPPSFATMLQVALMWYQC